GLATYEAGQGRTGWVIKHGKALRHRAHSSATQLRDLYGHDVQPLSAHSEYDPAVGPPTEGPNPAVDFLAVPVTCGGACWGVLRCVVRFRGKPTELFSQEKEHLLQVVGQEFGMAVERRHFQQLREKTVTDETLRQ